MKNIRRTGLVLMMALVLVASGITVALAEGTVPEQPAVTDNGCDSADPLVAEGSEGDQGDPGDLDEETLGLAEPAEGVEEPAEEPAEELEFCYETDLFRIEVGADGMVLIVKGVDGEDDTVIPVELTRTNNHGAYVSALAKAAPKGKGHGAMVKSVAQSNLGKGSGSDDPGGDEPLDIDQDEGDDGEVLSAGSTPSNGKTWGSSKSGKSPRGKSKKK